MPVPKTAVDKNNRLPFRQENIRLTQQISHMQPIPETCSVQHLPDCDFRLRVFATDPAHIP
jgi:hypothetical protein